MDNNDKPNVLPEKVVRRHAEMLTEILPAITQLVIEERRPADTILNKHLRNHRELGSRDRRFLAQAIFSYFRWYGWTVNKLQLPEREACLMGVALDTSELAESFQYLAGQCKMPPAFEPLGGKRLSDKAAALSEWFKDSPDFEPLKPVDLVPESFIELVDPEKVEACVKVFQQRPPAWMRSRTDPATIVQALAERDIPGTVHDRVASAIAVDGGVSLAHTLTPLVSQFVIQDIASQCVGLVCDPQTGDDWWDCCAGAGGKSLHLIDLMQQEGKVLATDVRSSALKELKKRARKHGIRNIRTQVFNAINEEPFRKTFDGVLADAPCSGWGTWSRNPDARWRTSRREITQCASRQLKILSNAIWCVKPGGKLVYSVCTVTRPETEEVVMNFLEQHPNFELDPFINPLTGEQTNGQMQIWPWDAPGDGMFIARFVRNAEQP